MPGEKADAFLKICSLTYRTFASFLTGQCLEAVILGSMFVITLSLLRMPYALLIGVLIAFTALVPIFGAFIGCGMGCFLIFMVSPRQAILFILVFFTFAADRGKSDLPTCGWGLRRSPVHLGACSGNHWWKSDGDRRNACIYPYGICILYNIPGSRISAFEKRHL